jgi:hypothetical protein
MSKNKHEVLHRHDGPRYVVEPIGQRFQILDRDWPDEGAVGPYLPTKRGAEIVAGIFNSAVRPKAGKVKPKVPMETVDGPNGEPLIEDEFEGPVYKETVDIPEIVRNPPPSRHRKHRRDS